MPKRKMQSERMIPDADLRAIGGEAINIAIKDLTQEIITASGCRREEVIFGIRMGMVELSTTARPFIIVYGFVTIE